jgi:hypothetical protein
MERVLKSFDLAESRRGRRAYVDWLEAWAENEAGNIDQTAQGALRRGWCLGEETFGDRLLDLVDKAKGVKSRLQAQGDAGGMTAKADDRGLRMDCHTFKMRNPSSVSRLVSGVNRDQKLEKML